MGRLKSKDKVSKSRIRGLRRRWFFNTAIILSALGLVCVLAVTAVFTASYYSSIESDMRFRAKTTTEFFSEYMDQDYDDYYQSCITYTQSFRDKNVSEIQFVDTQGKVIASSYSQWNGYISVATDISDAISSRAITSFIGKDDRTGERIVAVSGPVIYTNGEVIGVLRYITPTRIVDRQIVCVALISLCTLILVVAIVLVCNNVYIRSILVPLAEIIDKAKIIADGSYGTQIQTKFDDEIGELADTINEMSLKISQNEKLQTEFISSLSHELRTPLTAITGWSETLLNSEELNRDTRRGIKIILGETRRLTEMVVDLLDFTRIQDGRMTLNIEPADIRSEFEDTVYMYGSRLAQDGISLEYIESDDDFPEVSCDPKRMRQVFLNILDNAAKHGREGMKIDASIRCTDDTVIVQIRDYGSGIPEDELPLVKKKFYKGSSKARGSGIGLSVSDEIVQMHGGTLTLENADGGGTLVTVRLPAFR